MIDYDALDKHQIDCINRIYEHDISFIYATMGSGKTVCYLTAANELISENVYKRSLVVAPLKVAKETWAVEHSNWSHLSDLGVALAVGSPTARKKAIESSAPVVIINIENLAWFFDTYKHNHGLDMLCIDELSKFGSNSSKVVKKLRNYTRDFRHKVGLTGTPVHESFESLFSQTLVLDGGERYGRNKQKWLLDYFYATDYNGYNWDVRPDMKDKLLDRINDIIHVMPDYTQSLPTVSYHHLSFTLSENERNAYDEMEKHSVLESNNDVNIIAESAAVQSGKLCQLTSGFIYSDDDVHRFGDSRLNLLHQRLCDDYFHAKRGLIFYQYEEELNQLRDMLGSRCTTLDNPSAIEDWNNKTGADYLLLHPKSAGHGLNLQAGGSMIILYSPIWSNDQMKQLVGRLWRRGQTKPVYVYILVAENTVDMVRINRVESKEDYDKAFKQYLDSKRKAA